MTTQAKPPMVTREQAEALLRDHDLYVNQSGGAYLPYENRKAAHTIVDLYDALDRSVEECCADVCELCKKSARSVFYAGEEWDLAGTAYRCPAVGNPKQWLHEASRGKGIEFIECHAAPIRERIHQQRLSAGEGASGE